MTSIHIDQVDINRGPFTSNCERPSPSDIDLDPPRQRRIKRLPSAPDGGYGWVIVFGTFLTHFLIGSLERSEGIFYLKFQSRYNLGAQLTSWPGAIAGTIRLLLGPFASALSNYFSVRTCTLLGCILLFVAYFLTSLAPNFYFLFLSHGLIQGLGLCFIYTPSLIIVGMYFDKRRPFAIGLGVSGVGLGTFVFVPLMPILFDYYGFQETFFILSAWSLNFAVIAMLHRPLSLHYKFNHQLTSYDDDSEETFTLRPKQGKRISYDFTFNESSEQDHSKGLSENHPPDSVIAQKKNFNSKGCHSSTLQICFPREDSRFVKQTKRKIFHFYLLKNSAFLLFCISIMVFTAAFKSSLTFTAALIISKGYNDTEAAFILSILGIFDTLGRLITGLVFDMQRLRPMRPMFYNLILFILAAIAIGLPSINNYVSLCITIAFYGMLCGAYVSQKAIIIVDILGAENMASSFGILVLFQGIGSAVGPPLSGFFKDFLGSYDKVFYLGSMMMCVSGIFMIFTNIFLQIERRSTSRSERTRTS